MKTITAGLRAVSTLTRDCPDWERDLAMTSFREADLQAAERMGMVPLGTYEYANEIIELTIQGKIIAKTRCQWAEFSSPDSTFPRYPYRSYDTDRTKGVIVHKALSDLVALNKAHPELSLDKLYAAIQEKYWG